MALYIKLKTGFYYYIKIQQKRENVQPIPDFMPNLNRYAKCQVCSTRFTGVLSFRKVIKKNPGKENPAKKYRFRVRISESE